FFSSRRRHTRLQGDWSSDVCSSDLPTAVPPDLEVTEEVDCGDYTRARVVFDVEETMSVPAYLLVPRTRRDTAPGPAVLAVHGHRSEERRVGKEWGRRGGAGR